MTLRRKKQKLATADRLRRAFVNARELGPRADKAEQSKVEERIAAALFFEAASNNNAILKDMEFVE
jgi:hypothetical protein